jgi:hypothetical protein
VSLLNNIESLNPPVAGAVIGARAAMKEASTCKLGGSGGDTDSEPEGYTAVSCAVGTAKWMASDPETLKEHETKTGSLLDVSPLALLAEVKLNIRGTYGSDCAAKVSEETLRLPLVQVMWSKTPPSSGVSVTATPTKTVCPRNMARGSGAVKLNRALRTIGMDREGRG